ncbi:MAG: hypothetical protein A3H97_18575 [Acidobacteria bacterium RIFCSPLOWO2_02_FULL_65_29]|nr:MAG: hypothetical protein A3H97_18575 [Acidobacteria bacterium RIFCSPLOWO2_02_FULL_65_29]
MTDDELSANWGDWISRTAAELTELFEHRYLFNTLRAMFDHNPKGPADPEVLLDVLHGSAQTPSGRQEQVSPFVIACGDHRVKGCVHHG